MCFFAILYAFCLTILNFTIDKLKITGVARGSKEGLALKGLLEGGGHPQGQLGALEGGWGPSRAAEGP